MKEDMGVLESVLAEKIMDVRRLSLGENERLLISVDGSDIEDFRRIAQLLCESCPWLDGKIMLYKHGSFEFSVLEGEKVVK